MCIVSMQLTADFCAGIAGLIDQISPFYFLVHLHWLERKCLLGTRSSIFIISNWNNSHNKIIHVRLFTVLVIYFSHN